MKVDIKKALTYPFSDEKWIVKLIIGGLISLVPVLNFLSFGYIMRILKETSEGKEPKLPEWGDWENLFKEGAFGFLIGPSLASSQTYRRVKHILRRLKDEATAAWLSMALLHQSVF